MATWGGYLDALRSRRATFIDAGATASDHGHPSPFTADLSTRDAEALFQRVAHGTPAPGDAEMFRGQMLLEMAAMSVEDGLVLQLHTGSWRNHNRSLAARFGPDIGADMPTSTDYVGSLKPLLDRFGNSRQLTTRHLYARRDHLQPGAGPPGGPLPRAPARAAVVVLRQSGRYPTLLPQGGRNSWLLQPGGVQ